MTQAMRSRFPVDPARFPFFYGYWIVVVATLGVLASIPGQTMGVSVFSDAIIGATALSRLSVSNCYLAGTLMSAALLPLGGSLLDRHGARATGLSACLGLSASLVALSHVDRVGGIPWGARVASLSLLFASLRFWGQGMLTMISRTMLGRWFDRRRGQMAGISSVFVGFGFGVAPQVLHAWIQGAGGYQAAWRQIAAVVGLGMGACVWLFFRDEPERFGLELDGPTRAAPTGATAPRPDEVNATRAEALRTLRFWAVAAALSSQALVVTGVTFHIVDLGEKAGMDAERAVTVFLPMSVMSTAVGLLGGLVADRVRVRTLLLIMMGGQALGLIAAADLGSLRPLFVVGFGISGGLFSPLSVVAFPRFFGRLHLGAIAGAEMMLVVTGSALGPSLLALSEQLWHGYRPALLGLLALPLLASLLALGLRDPAASPARPA